MEATLPRAVLEAERKAEEAIQRLVSARQPQPPKAEGETPPANPQPATPPVVNGISDNPADSPAPAVTPPANAEGDDKWEARYKSLHGKYNAEVPRLHAALKERDTQLKSLTDEVEALKARISAKTEPLVKPEEVSEFGEPLVDLIRRAAREEVQAKDAEIAELRQKMDSLSTSATETREVGFYEKLSSQVPDWMAINDDPEFHAWLGEVDELTGAQRQAILSEAESKRDADRVVRFFKAFKRVQESNAAATRTSLESQTVPNTTKVEAPPAGKKVWTRGEISDFYARDRRGEYTVEQAAAIDADIQLAIRENRIR